MISSLNSVCASETLNLKFLLEVSRYVLIRSKELC